MYPKRIDAIGGVPFTFSMYFINNVNTITNTSLTNAVAKTVIGTNITISSMSIVRWFLQADQAYFTIYSEAINDAPYVIEIVISG